MPRVNRSCGDVQPTSQFAAPIYLVICYLQANTDCNDGHLRQPLEIVRGCSLVYVGKKVDKYGQKRGHLAHISRCALKDMHFPR